LVDFLNGIPEATVIATCRVPSESFTVEVVSIGGIKGEAISVHTYDSHFGRKATLGVRTAAKQMNTTLKRRRWNRRSPVTRRNAVPEQVGGWYPLFKRIREGRGFGHDYDITCHILKLRGFSKYPLH
jgi:hypothetical protein